MTWTESDCYVNHSPSHGIDAAASQVHVMTLDLGFTPRTGSRVWQALQLFGESAAEVGGNNFKL